MARGRSDRLILVAVSVCLFLSGAGSLMLEMVWSRWLRLVFGSTTLAVSTILFAYMLGLGAGGLLGGRLSGRLRNGLRAYGLFEVVIGLYALLVPGLLAIFPWLNRTLLEPLDFWPAALVRFAVVLLFLLVPTVLMGATLPVLVGVLVRRSSHLARRVGLLYGVNTLGAVGGTVVATFFLFPHLGLSRTNYVAVALDLVAGLAVLFAVAPRLAKVADGDEADSPAPSPVDRPGPGQASRWNPLLLSYGMVGATALVLEVAWTRVLSMILGSSVYAFATMLAAFLTGIALGSLLARGRLDRLRRPVVGYAVGVALLGVAAFATTLSFRHLPGLFVLFMQWAHAQSSSHVLVNVALSALVMLVPSLILGALFPLANRALSTWRQDHGRLVGDVYFVNTIGSATGAFAAGFILIPYLGLSATLGTVIGVNMLLAGALLARYGEWSLQGRLVAAAGAVALAAAVPWIVPGGWDTWGMTRGIYYRPVEAMDFGLPFERIEDAPKEEILYYRDGLNTTVSVEDASGGLTLRLNGKPDASLGDMSTQVLSAHLPMLFGGQAEMVAVVGYASGVTAGSVALYEPERVDVIELEPAVLDGARHFDPYNHAPLDNPRVRAIVDDGRNFLASTQDHYDVIISEPSNPWISGSASLFTREYFHIVRERLSPGGRLLQWIQLYGMDSQGVRAVLQAMHDEFGHVYGFLASSGSSDFLLVATDHELTAAELPDWESLSPALRADLGRIGIFSEVEILSLMRFTAADLRAMTDGAEVVNTDDNMFVELHLPWTWYGDPFSNWPVMETYTQAVAGLLTAVSDEMPADLLGQLAVAYLTGRQDRGVAGALLSRAGRDDTSPHVLTAMALFELQAGRAPAAVASLLDRAVGADPVAFEPRYQRAQVRMRLGEAAGALEDLDVCLANYPEDYRARHVRAVVHGTLGQVAEARRDVEFLLERNLGAYRWKWRLWLDAALASMALGETERAVDELAEYLERVPGAAREWLLMANLRERLGDTEGATRARESAERAQRAELAGRHREARRELYLGATARGARLLRALVEDHPDYAPAREDLERLPLADELP